MKLEGLNRLSKEIHEWAKQKGHWDKERQLGTLLMLVVSELGKAVEADRKDNYAKVHDTMKKEEHLNWWHDKDQKGETRFSRLIKDTFEDEMADVFYRLFDLCGRLGIDLEWHMKQKMIYNKYQKRQKKY